MGKKVDSPTNKNVNEISYNTHNNIEIINNTENNENNYDIDQIELQSARIEADNQSMSSSINKNLLLINVNKPINNNSSITSNFGSSGSLIHILDVTQENQNQSSNKLLNKINKASNFRNSGSINEKDSEKIENYDFEKNENKKLNNDIPDNINKKYKLLLSSLPFNDENKLEENIVNKFDISPYELMFECCLKFESRRKAKYELIKKCSGILEKSMNIEHIIKKNIEVNLLKENILTQTERNMFKFHFKPLNLLNYDDSMCYLKKIKSEGVETLTKDELINEALKEKSKMFEFFHDYYTC